MRGTGTCCHSTRLDVHVEGSAKAYDDQEGVYGFGIKSKERGKNSGVLWCRKHESGEYAF